MLSALCLSPRTNTDQNFGSNSVLRAVGSLQLDGELSVPRRGREKAFFGTGLSQLAVPGFGDQSGVALLGALLGKLRSTSGAAAGSPVALSLPPCAAAGASPEEAEASRRFAKAALADAAAVGGWGEVVALPTPADAAALREHGHCAVVVAHR